MRDMGEGHDLCNCVVSSTVEAYLTDCRRVVEKVTDIGRCRGRICSAHSQRMNVFKSTVTSRSLNYYGIFSIACSPHPHNFGDPGHVSKLCGSRSWSHESHIKNDTQANPVSCKESSTFPCVQHIISDLQGTRLN